MSSVDLDVLSVVHHVRVVHGGTGLPYGQVEARLAEPAWPHWLLRRRGADVVLAASGRFAADEPAQTALEVSVADERVLERFANGGVADVVLHQGADRDVDLVLQPTPVALEVAVVDRNGAPRTGRTVQARSNGTVVAALPEVGGGVYRSAPTTWDPQHQPFRIYVNTKLRGQTALDYERAITRVRVVDP